MTEQDSLEDLYPKFLDWVREYNAASASQPAFNQAQIVEVNGHLARVAVNGKPRGQFYPTLSPYHPRVDDQVLFLEQGATAVILGAVNRNADDESNLAGYAPLNSPAFSGTPSAPTPANTDESTRLATTEFIRTFLANIIGVGIELKEGNIVLPSSLLSPASGGSITFFPTDGSTLTAKAAIIVKVYGLDGILRTGKIPFYLQ